MPKGKKWGACLLGQNEANLKLLHINAGVSPSYRKFPEKKKRLKKNPTSWVYNSLVQPKGFRKKHNPPTRYAGNCFFFKDINLRFLHQFPKVIS